jgi:hypothetical protein
MYPYSAVMNGGLNQVLSMYTPSRTTLEQVLRISVDKRYDLFVRDIVALNVVVSDVLSQAFLKAAQYNNKECMVELLKVKGIKGDTLEQAMKLNVDFVTKNLMRAYVRKENMDIKSSFGRSLR